ncbi:MAG: cysteine desulfurase family protein [Planctomycetota bacterium]
MIYLDHNSTSPIAPSVIAKMTETLQAGFVNPASQHRAGQAARRQLEIYRSELIEMLGGNAKGMAADQLVFTSGGTESDNLALFGLAALSRQRLIEKGAIDSDAYPKVIVSAIEHPAVIAAAEQLARLGFEVHKLPVNQQGLVCQDTLRRWIESPTALVSIMLANNETGVIEPIQELASCCRQQGVLFHTDAVQAIGKIRVSFNELGVDALSLTAHKFAGPRGIGGLLLKHGVAPEPQLFGGFQQMAIRPGTEDVALVAGMWQALRDYTDAPAEREQHLRQLRDHLQDGLQQRFDGMVVNSAQVSRTPQTLNLAFPEFDRQSFLMSADMAGLAISTGSACASGSSEPSPVLMAMGLPKTTIEASIRISVGPSNSLDEIEQAIERISGIVQRNS